MASDNDRLAAYNLMEIINIEKLDVEDLVNTTYGSSERARLASKLGLGVELVERKSDKDSDIFSEYDEAGQGWEGYAFAILRVGAEFFRTDGSVSSYGYETWPGFFYPVKPIEKVITGYERV